MNPPQTVGPTAATEESVRAWQDLLAATPPAVREAVSEVVREGAETLTEEFYDRMMRNPRASAFLDQAQVQKRLRSSMRRWMTELFASIAPSGVTAAIARQIEVGAVHARLRLPIDLIPAGIRVLKRGIRRRIDFAPLDEAGRLSALVYVSDLLHLADSLMNQAYFHDVQEAVRNDEAYRLIIQKRSMSFERTRQRAALSEWAEALLLAAWSSQPGAPFVRLRDAEFGIWMHHKGATLLGDSDDFRSILVSIDTMDNHLLPRLREAAQDRQRTDGAIVAVKNLLDLIRFTLNDLFDRTGCQDDGMDIETRLPDRRYLPAILSSELKAHNENARPCCLLMIEVQLPALKGAQSTGARSRMMQAAVGTLTECARTSDHLFRFDDQRFLLLAVECTRSQATLLANNISEELRNALQAGNVQGSWTPVHSGVSIGVAEYDRHPDYQYLVQRAEAALAEASASAHSRIAFA